MRWQRMRNSSPPCFLSGLCRVTSWQLPVWLWWQRLSCRLPPGAVGHRGVRGAALLLQVLWEQPGGLSFHLRWRQAALAPSGSPQHGAGQMDTGVPQVCSAWLGRSQRGHLLPAGTVTFLAWPLIVVLTVSAEKEPGAHQMQAGFAGRIFLATSIPLAG